MKIRNKRKMLRNARRINPLKLDPTRTITLRRAFAAELRRRFRRLRLDVIELVLREDAFGLKVRKPFNPLANVFCPTGEGGGVDPSCSPGKPTSKERVSREDRIKEAAASIVFSEERVTTEEVSSRDYNAIGAAMTWEERAEMEDNLIEARDSAINEYMSDYDPEVSERDVADESGWSARDTEDKIDDVLKDEDVEVDTSLERQEYGVRGIDTILDRLPEDAPEHVREALSNLRDEAEKDVASAMREAEQSAVDEYRSELERNYDNSDDRIEYLRRFHGDNEDRFTTTSSCPDKTWCRDSYGDGLLEFSTSGGSKYKVAAINTGKAVAGVPVVDMQFRDDSGSFKVTGAGAAFEVFSNVVPAVVSYLKVKNVKLATFSASEPSRQKLYDRLVKTVAKTLPEYFAVTSMSGSTKYYGVIRREMREQYEQYAKEKGLVSEVLVNERYEPSWWTVEGWLTYNEYNPDQARDEGGRWSSMGGGGAAGQYVRESKMPNAVVEALKSAGAGVAHIEHAAKAYVNDKISTALGNLPLGVQEAVEAVWSVGKSGTGALFAAYTLGQHMAERVAKERGLSDEQARRLRGMLSKTDLGTFEVFKVGALAGVHAAHLPALVTGTIPVASATYLAYSTARNPLATIRAAGGLVNDALDKAAGFLYTGPKRPTGNAEIDAANALADALAAVDYDDWWIALYSAALDGLGSGWKALELANRLHAENPVLNEWVTLGEDSKNPGQHVWIGESGEFSPSGPSASGDTTKGGHAHDDPGIGKNKTDSKGREWGSKEQPFWRPGANPTVDNIITRDGPKGREVLLIKRGEKSAEGGKWALPGGFHDTESKKGERWKAGKETAQEAALRELKEETGLDIADMKGLLEYVGQYEGKGRDPRDNDEAWSKSNAFRLHLPRDLAHSESVKGMDDAQDARWVPVRELGSFKMAFDHAKIIKDSGIIRNMVTNAGRWAFRSMPEQLEAFQAWLQRQVKLRVLGAKKDELWAKYAEAGMRKGAGRAFDDASKSEKVMAEAGKKLDFHAGTRDQFLRSAFRQPVAVEKLKILAGRTYDDLEGVTDSMSVRMSRVLTDGLAQGKSPLDVADDLAVEVDISQARAEVVARTETIRAHAEGQLEALEQLGVEEVGVMVEWSVTDGPKYSELTPKERRTTTHVCRKCEPMEGVVLKLAEAHGMIPRHPNCLVGNTPILAPGLLAAMRSFYSGLIYSITTASGGVVSVTKNHIFLTSFGFVPAYLLYEGLDLVDTRLACPEFSHVNDGDDRVATIQDVFESFSLLGDAGMTGRAVGVNFHGDGQFMNGEVSIVGANSVLRNEAKAGLGRLRVEQQLPSVELAEIDRGLSFFSPATQFLEGIASACDSSMGRFRELLALLLGRLLHAKTHRFTPITGREAGICQSFVDEAATAPEHFRQCLAAHPILKQLDDFSFRDLANIAVGGLVRVLSEFDVYSFFAQPPSNGILRDAECRGQLLGSYPRGIEPNNFGMTRSPLGSECSRHSFVASSEYVQPSPFQSKSNCSFIDADYSSDLGSSLARAVQLDKVVDIKIEHVRSLPVYDVQTQSSLIIAGNITQSQCRCAWIPANVGESDEDQKDSKKSIESALAESLDEGEEWGPGVGIAKNRPESILENGLSLNWCNQYGGDTCKGVGDKTAKARAQARISKGKQRIRKPVRKAKTASRAAPGKEAPKESGAASRIHAERMVTASLRNNDTLSDEQKLHYSTATETVLDNMGVEALKRFAENTKGGIHFYRDISSVKEGVISNLEKMGPRAEQALGFMRNLKGTVAGAYQGGSKGSVHVDGDKTRASANRAEKAHEVYAHEFAHAIDGRRGVGAGRISDGKDWQGAWKSEISGGKLNKYAASKSSEGFAEFGRLLLARGHDHAEVKRQFPLSYGVWRKHGLVNEKSRRSTTNAEATSSAPFLTELFGGRVELPDGHADLFLKE